MGGEDKWTSQRSIDLEEGGGGMEKNRTERGREEEKRIKEKK